MIHMENKSFLIILDSICPRVRLLHIHLLKIYASSHDKVLPYFIPYLNLFIPTSNIWQSALNSLLVFLTIILPNL